MILGAVMSVLLVSQLAFAQTFKITPLQAYTTPTNSEAPQASWQLGQEYYLKALFSVRGNGSYYARIKVTDVKTGYSGRFPKEGPFVATDGAVQAPHTSGALSADLLPGVDPRLPRPLMLTYEFKEIKPGATWKVSTKVWYYETMTSLS
jgi:hypothetical protein